MRSSRIISFDLSHTKTSSLDISRFFPLSELHPIHSTKIVCDTIQGGRGYIHDLSLSHTLTLSRFRTLSTLDLGRSDLYKTDFIGRTIFDESLRPRVLDIFPPLRIPYGALDIRGDPITCEKKYSDIYRRSLPWSLHIRRVRRDFSRYMRKNRKNILIGVALFLFFSVPALLYTRSLLIHGYTSLISAIHADTPEQIIENIRNARSDFERANIIFFPFRWIPGDTLALAKVALDGGLSLSRGLHHIGDTLSMHTGTIIDSKISRDSLFRPTSKSFSPLSRFGIQYPTEWLENNTDTLIIFYEYLKQTQAIYKSAETLDHPLATNVVQAGEILSRIGSILDFIITNISHIQALLGHEIPERYIIFNQNRDEIRANGGFPGSIITFTLYKGNIEDFRTDDVYYYDWNLYPYKELPPPGIALITGNYGLRDVNYYPFFGDSLEKANSFIEKSGDPTVTVGIAIHQGIIEDMIGTLGGISLSGVNIPFTKENFSPLMSTLVESRFGERTSAKDILSDFVDAFIKKVSEKRAYSQMYDIIYRSIEDGEILFASRNPSIENFLSNYRKPFPSGPNWAYPLLTSISGNKSDRYITRFYQAETKKISECKYENKLTFTHMHTFSKEHEREIQNYMNLAGMTDSLSREKMLFIQGKGKNTIYMRLIVPQQAVLTGSVAGIEVKKEGETQTFAFTISTPVAGTTSKTIRYTIDIPECDGSLPLVEWYRQPGLNNTKMESR